MIYNLYLNSLIYHASTPTPGNRGTRIFAVDWSFLPDKQFKLTFRFITRKLTTLTCDNNYLIQCNLGATTTRSGGDGSNQIGAASNTIIGMVYSRPATTTTTADLQLTATYLENPPIFLNSRPSNNLLTVQIVDYLNGVYNLSVEYMLILSFEVTN
jgi:hypothetical protein